MLLDLQWFVALSSTWPGLSANQLATVGTQRHHLRLNSALDISKIILWFFGNLDLFHSSNWYFSFRYWSKI